MSASRNVRTKVSPPPRIRSFVAPATVRRVYARAAAGKGRAGVASVTHTPSRRRAMSDECTEPQEATIERTEAGARPAGLGWFIVNLTELAARDNERLGITCSPEPADAPFEEFGFNVRVLKRGQCNGMYHR